MRRIAFVMAGGGGERFWPLSTPERPKQLLHLTSPDESLLQEAVSRLLPMMDTESIHVATASGLEDIIREAEPRLGARNLLSEPTRRNTLGCMVWTAAMMRARHGRDVVLGYVTADHQIGDPDKFRSTLDACYNAAESSGALVTIGIKPTRTETGYGYIEADAEKPGGARDVLRFHEKPNAETAEEYLRSGHFYWNSGMFFWSLPAFEAQLAHADSDAAECYSRTARALESGDEAGARKAFEELQSISIDFALLEKASECVMIVGDFPWDDVGAWDALDRSRSHDENGNVAEGAVSCLVDVRDSIVCNYSEGGKMEVSVVGAEDLVVVVTDDKVLVVPKAQAQKVRLAARRWATRS